MAKASAKRKRPNNREPLSPGFSRRVNGVPVLSEAEQFKLLNQCVNEIGKVMERFDHLVPFIRITGSED